ncbi:MAG: LLM class F420-dependent oxidoreductase [Acidimicrobiia bacterium]|nr:LLM class F420-dependent oxidoreductase [Acidimicrobiia bacterium]
MKLGIVTPVVTLNPRAHAPWEETAGVDELVAVAREADGLGYDFLTCSEHVAVPEAVAPLRGSRYWDPGVTLGFLAAVTEHVRLATYVLVLGYHHPLELAKRYGTLDRVSGGRLVLGVGVGSLREEFELLGADFEGRGEHADDALRALRASLSRPRPAYAGSHHAFDGFVVDPCAVQARVPIWVGGRTARSLRRAVELADGWSPFQVEPEQVAGWLARARDTEAWERRARPLEVVVQARHLDPVGEPGATRDAVARHGAAGATALALRFTSRSAGHLLEQLLAMRELVATA